MGKLLILSVLLLLIGCFSMYTRQNVNLSYKKYSQSKTDFSRLAYLMDLNFHCERAANRELSIKNCGAIDFNREFALFRNKYPSSIAPGIVILPEGRYYNQYVSAVASNGLRSYPYRSGYQICGQIFNLSRRKIKAVKVQVRILDNFEKQIGVTTIQKSFRFTIEPFNRNLYYDPMGGKDGPNAQYTGGGMICSATFFSDISPQTVGRVVFQAINVK